MKRLVLATLVVVGVANAIDLIVNGMCEGGKFGKCPEGERCTEFGYCIKTSNESNDLVRCPNGHSDCPTDKHCNEFKICIDGAPSNDLKRCAKNEDCDISKEHCNEFKICIGGAPSNDNGLLMCTSDADCAAW